MIRKATAEDHSSIINIWRLSVKATHDFLPENYFLHIMELLPAILASVPVFVKTNEENNIIGFLGVVDAKIEMLFIHPAEFGKGYGKELMEFAIAQLGANKVDVNEQNKQAAEFYKRIGFVVTGRSETDGLGKPYPLLHLELRKRFPA